MGVIHAGALRHRVDIQNRIAARGVQGGFTYTWSLLRTVWASVSPKTGNEYFFSDAVRANASHFITIRAQTETLTPDMRLVFGTRVFNIISVLLVDEIKHQVTIAAIESLSVSDSPTGIASIPLVFVAFETQELDFTALQSVATSMATGKRFFIDSVEIVCTSLTGTVVTQPTITSGITGNLTKYLNRLPTLITALNKRQSYSGLGANDGEVENILGISVAGAVSAAGVYKGILFVKGVLIG